MRAFGVGAVVMAFAAAAGAEPAVDATNQYSLAWVRDDGADSCPAQRDLAAEVTRRLGRSPFDERAARSIEIRVERDATAFRSRVLVREADGRVIGQRVLSNAGDCAPLFSATALAVALLIDPDATIKGDQSATQAVASFTVVEPRPAPSTAANPPAASAPTTPAAPTTPVVRTTAPAPPSERDAGGMSAHAVLASGIVPGAVPGAELFVRKRVGRQFGWAASALYLSPGTVSGAGATFNVGLTAFGASALVELADSHAVTAGLEAGALVGALHTAVLSGSTTSTTTVVPTDPGDFLFLALDGGLNIRAKILRSLFLEAHALALVPLIRRSLEVKPASSAAATSPARVWTQPPVGVLGALGLGVPFP